MKKAASPRRAVWGQRALSLGPAGSRSQQDHLGGSLSSAQRGWPLLLPNQRPQNQGLMAPEHPSPSPQGVASLEWGAPGVHLPSSSEASNGGDCPQLPSSPRGPTRRTAPGLGALWTQADSENSHWDYLSL